MRQGALTPEQIQNLPTDELIKLAAPAYEALSEDLKNELIIASRTGKGAAAVVQAMLDNYFSDLSKLSTDELKKLAEPAYKVLPEPVKKQLDRASQAASGAAANVKAIVDEHYPSNNP